MAAFVFFSVRSLD